MSVLQRALAWLRGERREPEALGDGEDPRAMPEPPEPAVLRPPEESWLATLIADVAEGERLGAIGSAPFWEKLYALFERGHERLAVEWLEKFLAIASLSESIARDLRKRLVEWRAELGEVAEAIPHLEVLAETEETAVRAHYLLAEHYRRAGEEARALRHYEAVLARDMDYMNARSRVEKLKRTRGEEGGGAAGETVIGAEAPAGDARYQLLRELGRGGSGAVYLARDAELEREVAVKLLHPHTAGDQRAEARARFFDEARAAASLRHPNIIAILDLDESARRLVMELAAAGTLRDVLRERGPRPVLRALQRHAQILSALSAAHRRGIVHRDLKPGNLMFRRDPDAPGSEIVLADFGVAHLPGEATEKPAGALEAAPAEAVGTLAYMAPEQRRGADADPRSDLYAAAVVLYEMLTGHSPWPRDVLLSGARSAADFALPEGALGAAPAELQRRIAEHLRALGDPEPENRPDTERAAAEAFSLRDAALAAAPSGPSPEG